MAGKRILFQFRVVHRVPATAPDGSTLSSEYSKQEVIASGEVMADNDSAARAHAMRSIPTDIDVNDIEVMVAPF